MIRIIFYTLLMIFPIVSSAERLAPDDVSKDVGGILKELEQLDERATEVKVSSTLDFQKVISGLGGVLVLLLGVTFWAKARGKGLRENSIMKIKQRIMLHQKAAAILIEIRGEEFLTLVSGDQIKVERLWATQSIESEIRKDTFEEKVVNL